MTHKNNINSASKKININNQIKDIIADHNRAPIKLNNIKELANQYEGDDQIKSMIEIYINIEKISVYNIFNINYAIDLTDKLIKIQKE